MRRDGEREPHIHPGAIQVDSLAPARLTLRAALRQSPERLPRRLGHRRVDELLDAGEVDDLVELGADFGFGHAEDGAIEENVFASA